MGLFDGRSHSYSDGHSQSRTRGFSPARSTHSTGNGRGYYTRPHAGSTTSGRGVSGSGSSFFGNFGGSSSSRGWFSGGGSSSYYKRSPRQGYVTYLMHKLQRMLRDLWAYARRHPMKAFFAVVVPLLSAGGAIHGLLRQFGVRVPLVDGGMRSMSGAGGYYGSAGYGGLGGESGGTGGWMDNAGSLMQIAKAFM